MSMRYVSKPCAVSVLMLTAFVYANPCGAQDNSPVPSVAGTTWGGNDADNDYYEYQFRKNHKLDYNAPNGFYKNGTCKQIDDMIYMETNHRFSEQQGRIVGTHMSGDAWNVGGEKWTWQADEK